MNSIQSQQSEYKRDRFNDFKKSVTTRSIAKVLLGGGGCIIIVGYIYLHRDHIGLKSFMQDFYANFGAEFVSIAITVLVLERLHENQVKEERKKELMQHLGSPSNNFAVEAARLLRLNGWGFGPDTCFVSAEIKMGLFHIW